MPLLRRAMPGRSLERLHELAHTVLPTEQHHGATSFNMNGPTMIAVMTSIVPQSTGAQSVRPNPVSRRHGQLLAGRPRTRRWRGPSRAPTRPWPARTSCSS